MKNILIHGLGQDNRSWEAVQKLLETENLTTHCPKLFDLLKDDSYTYQNLYQQLERQLNHYDDKVNLCGLSLGGLLALDYAKNYPNKVNSSILIGVPYKIPPLLMTIQSLVFKLMPKASFIKLGLTKDEFIRLISSTKSLSIHTDLEKISCQTLIICGEKDKLNLKSSQLFHEAIKQSALKTIKNAGHEVNRDNPSDLAGLISAFWKR
ncbi:MULTISPECIES: alpha/beta fold hydrolase [Aerococcus]|uniref:alpha/beta fold hydrolase n=1 Tax=Aerococcus TaxID=1375 RepID=UPI000DCD20BD|nr:MULTISPECIES: alpha/beta hydrolase [Aerococcus]KAA9219226.1 alpha/beta hydrolase [Aerococcus loyolae]KAA9266641.1 alpha/beta hydrolase [Aerococcus loyolae]MDK6231472.1 alpha/beta hydrolase [Aerococcus urinae]MDK6257996.1 alpha/beta hydrolase [Aerococcus urinae]MDK6293725.1 alpha/beta hydrolase [Aerococcus urinae]